GGRIERAHPALPLDLAAHFLDLLGLAETVEQHVRAVACQRAGDPESDARGRAGDDGSFCSSHGTPITKKREDCATAMLRCRRAANLARPLLHCNKNLRSKFPVQEPRTDEEFRPKSPVTRRSVAGLPWARARSSPLQRAGLGARRGALLGTRGAP